MEINKKESWDQIKNPGDYLISNKDVDGHMKYAGIVMMCKCGDVISLSNKIHTFKSYEPLDITPSILHKRDDISLPDCHFFIKEGKYIQA